MTYMKVSKLHTFVRKGLFPEHGYQPILLILVLVLNNKTKQNKTTSRTSTLPNLIKDVP